MSTDPPLYLRAAPALLQGWCGPLHHERFGAITATGRTDEDGMWQCLSSLVDNVEPYTPEELFFDLSQAGCRDHVARLLLQSVKHRHGRTSKLHPVVWVGPARAVLLPHRFSEEGREGSVRLDGFCATCDDERDRDGHTYIHQDWLLEYRDGTYQGSDRFWDLDPTDDRKLADGTRLMDAMALLTLAEIRFH